MVASSFAGYGIMIYSSAQTPPENDAITVGILDPDYGDTVSGVIMIRAIILHSHLNWEYTVSVLINGIEISSSVPCEWDSNTVDDGWYTITVQVTDTKGNVRSDEVIIYVENNPSPTPRARVCRSEAYDIARGYHVIDFDEKNYDTTDNFNLATDVYTIPENGYYQFVARVVLWIAYEDVYWILRVEVCLYIDGGLLPLSTSGLAGMGAGVTLSVTDTLYFSEGEQIDVHLYLWAGIDPDAIILGDYGQTCFSITKLDN
ncbi:MAG: hypothetical protein JSV62_15085 [Promethearchaeota archaeon]|nr:MAG: hypothetical protein JSV62_15085 [Candidatus Lokiarchaeota archaeon]